MKRTALVFIVMAAAAHAQTVRPVQHTNGTVVSPTNFWSKAMIQISNVSGLQAELNSKLSAVASWSITNVTGLQAALDSKLATNGTLPIGNVSGFSVLGLSLATNTDPATIRQSAGLALQALTNQSAADFRTAIGLNSAATNPATAFQPSSSVLTNLAANNAATLTNFPASLLRTNGSAAGLSNFPAFNQNTTGTASNVTGVVAITNGGTGATNAAAARSNLELGAAWLTNSDVSNFRSDINLGTNSEVYFSRLFLTRSNSRIVLGGESSYLSQSNFTFWFNHSGNDIISITTNRIALIAQGAALSFGTGNTTGAAISRTNLGLGAMWLTNQNSPFITLPIAMTNGGTGATNAAAARSNLGFVGTGDSSFIGGGTGNTASGQLSVVNGGIFNSATNGNSTIGGGGWNTASGTGATVAGGVNNQSSGSWSTIAGGQANAAAAAHSGVGGGNYNTINGQSLYAHIGGGLSNTIGGTSSYWSNGVTWDTPIQSPSSTIAGGEFNVARLSGATVGGGQSNMASGLNATVSGGRGNTASGSYAFATGDSSTASAEASWATGRRAQATNPGAFVWADSQGADFSSTNSDSFNIRATGGMSLDLGTNGISFRAPMAAAVSRTNLGLGSVWLTNPVAPLFWTGVPAATNSPGTPGSIAYSNNHLFICVSSNSWRRTQLGTW